MLHNALQQPGLVVPALGGVPLAIEKFTLELFNEPHLKRGVADFLRGSVDEDLRHLLADDDDLAIAAAPPPPSPPDLSLRDTRTPSPTLETVELLVM